MKKLNVSFEGTADPTGYLFSFAKCLSAALRCGGYEEYADDIVATSGFAFRMWVAPDLCPSGTSIWEFAGQKRWVENGGLVCGYAERLWGQDGIEAERRAEALRLIRESVDRGTAAVAWDLSGCEWGLATGYDDETNTLTTLKISGREDSLPYDKLGKLDIPILSVLTVTGKAPKPAERLVADTKALAKEHLTGREWCDNPKGLAAYDTLIGFVRDKLSADSAWNLEYYLGTYAALKLYALRFFEKYGEEKLALLYAEVSEGWQNAFDILKSEDIAAPDTKNKLIEALCRAQSAERTAVGLM